MDQGGGQRHSPGLPAAQLPHHGRLVGQLEKGDQEGDSPVDDRRRQSVEAAKEEERLLDGELIEEANLLGHVADARPGDQRPVGTGYLAKDLDDAPLRLQGTDQAVHQGRLAATGGPEDSIAGKKVEVKKGVLI